MGCRLSEKAVADPKAVKAVVALSSVPCVGSWYHEIRLRRLHVGRRLLIRSWLRSFARRARIWLLGLTQSIIVFLVLCIVVL